MTPTRLSHTLCYGQMSYWAKLKGPLLQMWIVMAGNHCFAFTAS